MIITAGLLDAQLQYPLGIWFPPAAAVEQSPVNNAVAAFVRNNNGESRLPWYGTAVVMKYSGSRRACYVEMTNYDLGSVAAYYMSQQDA